MKVVLIAPRFFGFETEITNCIRKLGIECKYFPEKPELSPRVFSNMIQKVPVAIYNKIFDRYCASILQTDPLVEKVIMIRGEHWQSKHLELMRLSFPNAKFLFYQWDDVKSLKFFNEQKSHFDKIYTFSKDDATGEMVNFKPLFYKESFFAARNRKSSENFKVAFVGSDYGDRQRFVERFKNLNGIKNNEFFCHLYRSRSSYYYNKYIRMGGNLDSNFSEFQPKPLGEADVIASFLSSRIILDVNPTSQVGLSARIFEAIALGKKIITTNKHIVEYDFYNPSNIFVVDRENPVVPRDFWDSLYTPQPDQLLQMYSSSKWVSDFFE